MIYLWWNPITIAMALALCQWNEEKKRGAEVEANHQKHKSEEEGTSGH